MYRFPDEKRQLWDFDMEDRQAAALAFAMAAAEGPLPNALEPGCGMTDDTKLQLLLSSPDCFFDPFTGVAVEKGTGLLRCNKRHLTRDLLPSFLYQPCEDCGVLCSCDRGDWPDVFVRTLEGKDIRVGSALVQGSAVLQTMIKEIEEEEGSLAVVSEEEEGEPRGVQDLFEFPKKTLVDLREGEGPTLGLTEEEWRIAETFMGLHFDHIDEMLAAERRAREFFRLSLFQRPPRDPVNFWSFPDWEEEFFGKMSKEEFLQLAEIFRILDLYDGHVLYKKWTVIFRGIPNVKDFGIGKYMTEMDREEEQAGCRDFLGSRPIARFKKNFHSHRLPDYHIPDVSPFTSMLWRKRIWNKYPIEIGRFWYL